MSLYSENSDVSLFVERLSALASEKGLRKIEIAGIQGHPGSLVRAMSADGDRSKFSDFHPINISFEGKYEALAEYFKELRTVEWFSRVIQFRIRPGEKTIKTDIVIEIIPTDDRNAA